MNVSHRKGMWNSRNSGLVIERINRVILGGERDSVWIQVNPGSCSSMLIGWIGGYSLVLKLILVLSIILSVGVPLFFGRRVVESRSAKYLGGSVGIFIM